MPVVELNINRIRKLVSGKTTRKQILDVLPFLGLDIESEDGDEIRIEYSPNRPDYSTDYGIATGLQGLLGIKKRNSKNYYKEKRTIYNQSRFLCNKDSALRYRYNCNKWKIR